MMMIAAAVLTPLFGGQCAKFHAQMAAQKTFNQLVK
jgi:hypothetical protein